MAADERRLTQMILDYEFFRHFFRTVSDFRVMDDHPTGEMGSEFSWICGETTLSQGA
jgi:hypothetical protein